MTDDELKEKIDEFVVQMTAWDADEWDEKGTKEAQESLWNLIQEYIQQDRERQRGRIIQSIWVQPHHGWSGHYNETDKVQIIEILEKPGKEEEK